MSRRYDCADPGERAAGLVDARVTLSRGELVVLPTDTVYGIGADAFTSAAVTALLAAKGRGRDMPVPVLVGSWRTLDGLVAVVPLTARALVEAFWPGPVTLVLRHAPSLAWDLGDARGTVAIRMPLHPVALELLRDTGPLAVSSANRSGAAPAISAPQAQAQLGDAVGVYLDAGETDGATPSSIVDLTGERPRLLRAGAVALEQLREVVPEIDDVA